MRREISKNETKWIYKLRTMQRLGINKGLDLNGFLSND